MKQGSSKQRRTMRRLGMAGLAIHLAVGAGIAGSTAASAYAQAVQAVRYDVPAGDMIDALNRFAQQSGVSIALEADKLQGLKTDGLKGTYQVEDGFNQLLRGSGYAVGKTAAGYVLVPAAPAAAVSAAETPTDARKLATITVNERRAANGTTEGTGSYTSRVTSIASKSDQAFREVPQSVSVLTRQQLDDQQITEINEALRLVPGITVVGESTDIYSRGFQISSMQIDGGAPMALGAYTYTPQQDMAFYDRVEVMRGASGLLAGVGDPGGVINIVRKKPLAERQVLASFSLGSWNNRRTELDVSSPLTQDGRIRGRAVLAYENKDSFVDYRSTEKPMAYGVIEADLTPDTLLTFGGSFTRIHDKGDGGGLPRYTTGGSLNLSRSNNLAQPWAYTDTENTEVFAQLEQRLANHWRMKVNLAHTESKRENAWNFAGGAVNPTTLTGTYWRGGLLAASNKQDMADISLSGPFKLFGRTHELLVGADWQRVKSMWTNGNFAGNGTVAANVFDPSSTPWNPVMSATYSSLYSPWGQEQYGAYGVLRLHPTDYLHVVTGARVSRYNYDQRISSLTNGVWVASSDRQFSEATKVTPYGGVIVDLNDQWSTYLSYSAIYNPQATYLSGPLPGTPLAPVKGRALEAGIKGELMDGKLNTTFSVFDVQRTGSAAEDPAYPTYYSRWNGSCCYLPSGKVTSRGFDVEVGGEVRPGWQLTAGYTFNQTTDESTGGIFSAITPKHLFKLATMVRLPGELSRWKVGGNARIQSSQYVSGTAIDASTNASVPYNYTQGGYALLGASAEFKIDSTWTALFTVDNLLDKTYYRTLSGSYSGNYYGSPRNWMLTLRGKF